MNEILQTYKAPAVNCIMSVAEQCLLVYLQDLGLNLS